MTNVISRVLLGKIVDEVFGGAVEDARVIEEIYAVIKREDAAPPVAEPVCCGKPVHVGSPEAYTLECCEKFIHSAPSVAAKAAKTKCKNCGGNLNSWFTSNRVNSVAVDGRLKSSEISCDFVLGCDECSETLRVVPADKIASQMNAALSAEVQEVAAIAQLNAIVDAWEALPGGRQVRNSDIEAWLGKHMAPAINTIRAFLSRPLPEGA
jgi:hypothetical protein